jgi:protein TonB
VAQKLVYLSIPTPCSEAWDKMTTAKQGKHCASCNKTVIDFSLYTDKELVDFFHNNYGLVCGKLNNYQVNRNIITTEQPRRTIFHKLFLGTALASWLGFTGYADAQNSTPHKVQQNDNPKKDAYDTTKGMNKVVGNKKTDSLELKSCMVGEIVQPMPRFNYNGMGVNQYIAKNLVYPKEAADKNMTGTVYVNFTVKEDGSVAGVKLLKSSSYPLLDSAAVDVVRKMPKWRPGIQNNKNIATQMNLPINFSLPEEKKSGQ